MRKIQNRCTTPLYWARKKKGMTRAEACALLHIDARTLIRWENGETRPNYLEWLGLLVVYAGTNIEGMVDDWIKTEESEDGKTDAWVLELLGR